MTTSVGASAGAPFWARPPRREARVAREDAAGRAFGAAGAALGAAGGRGGGGPMRSDGGGIALGAIERWAAADDASATIAPAPPAASMLAAASLLPGSDEAERGTSGERTGCDAEPPSPLAPLAERGAEREVADEADERALASFGTENRCSRSGVGISGGGGGSEAGAPRLPRLPGGAVGARGVKLLAERDARERGAGRRAELGVNDAGESACSPGGGCDLSCRMSYSTSAASCRSRAKMSCKCALWSRSSSRRKTKTSRSSGERAFSRWRLSSMTIGTMASTSALRATCERGAATRRAA